MFKRLFGYTEEEQMAYLQPRILITGPVLILGFIAMMFGYNGGIVFAIAAYVWAWTFLKNWFGITSLASCLSNNVVTVVLLFLAYLVVGYFLGLITFVLGLFRYIQLLFFRG